VKLCEICASTHPVNPKGGNVLWAVGEEGHHQKEETQEAQDHLGDRHLCLLLAVLGGSVAGADKEGLPMESSDAENGLDERSKWSWTRGKCSRADGSGLIS
jgi:hypothetical protein